MDKLSVPRDNEEGKEYFHKRWLDEYYDESGNLIKTITSDGDIVNRQYDENGKLIYIESSDSDTIILSKHHFNIERKSIV